MASIRLNRKDNTIKVFRRTDKVRLQHKTSNISLKHSGQRGPQGLPGEQGEIGYGVPAGGLEGYVLEKASDADYDFSWLQPTYSDKNYQANFSVSSEVVVNHNLSKYPTVTVIDSAGDEVEGSVEHIDTNSLRLIFSAAFSGRVVCN